MQFARLAMDEQRDGNAPSALARDAPVRTIFDHSGDALLAPLRRPLDGLDVSQSVRTQTFAVHADEPLRRSAENDWSLVTPAVRIAVTDGLMMHKAPTLLQHLDKRRIRLVDLEASNQRR